MSEYIGDFKIGSTIHFYFNTRKGDGTPITIANTAVCEVRKNGTAAADDGTFTVDKDFNSVTGYHHVAIDTSGDATFYAAGNDFDVVIKSTNSPTVDSISITGARVGSFSLENRTQFPTGAVTTDAGNSATSFETNRTESADNHWNDCFLLITSGTLLGQVRKVTGYNGTTKIITVGTAFTGTPADGTTFALVNR